jgi:hypothetical protein
MDLNSINSALNPSELHLIVPESEQELPTTESIENKTTPIQQPWNASSGKMVPIPIPPPAPLPEVKSLYPHPMVYPAIEQFVKKAAKIPGIKCMVIEEAEGQIVHVSTFAEPVNDELRDAIYSLEAATINAFPDIVFDFHLRLASEVDGGTPIPVPGQRYYAVWGQVNAIST